MKIPTTASENGKPLRIVSADTGKMPKSLFDDMPVVTVTLEDGTTERLFTYYPDEIHFSAQEFVGLTIEE